MRRGILVFCFCLPFLIVFLFGCNKKMYAPENINFEEVPYKTLSEYGFFEGEMKNMNGKEGVLSYEPISSLFSDYTEKSRYVWMPKGTSCSISDKDGNPLLFPNKAILVKNFYYDKAENGQQRIMETRLLVKTEDKWNAYAYVWNEDQTEANYKITGASIPVKFTNKYDEVHSIDYIQPNKNQCKSCHNEQEQLMPIGPKVRNLNYEIAYADGEKKNQLVKWFETGYLDDISTIDDVVCMVDYEDENADLDLRAKAYLDINCAHCHKSNGPASTSGLYLTYGEKDLTKWGVYKPPVAAGSGAGLLTYDIHPGKADSSIFIHRMKSTQAGVMMPEIGRITPHKEGIELIENWINDMAIR